MLCLLNLRLLCSEIATEVQVRKYGKFLDEYTTQLQDIERVLDDSRGDCWDHFLDPLAIEVMVLSIHPYL